MATATRGSRRQAREQAFPYARTLVHISGVPIRVDVSWVIIALLVVWVYVSQLGTALADRGAAVVVPAAVVAALLFFVCLLAHELGHALESLHRDVPVDGITLFLLGGVTESRREAQTWRDELAIVGIGPFISLGLAAVFGLAAAALSAAPVAAHVAGYLGWTNLALGVFNVVPAFPLDGGRLLHAFLWGVTGHRHRATRWAARVGQALAALIIAVGVSALLTTPGFGGLWWVLIGYFLFRGAGAEHERATLHERLADRPVRDLMRPAPPALEPSQPLSSAIEQVQQRPESLWPVGDPVRGVLTLEDIDAVPADRWATTTVAEVAAPADDCTVDVDDPLPEVLDRLGDSTGQAVLVLDDGHAVGVINVARLERETG